MLPASLRIEMVRETGAPQVVTDNAGTIKTMNQISSGGGCRVTPSPASRGTMILLVFIGGLVITLRRRRGQSQAR